MQWRPPKPRSIGRRMPSPAADLDHLKAALAEFGLPGGPVRVALDGPDDAALQRIRAVADLLD